MKSMKPRTSFWPGGALPLLLCLLPFAAGPGCSAVQTVAEVPGKTVEAAGSGRNEKKPPPADPVVVQQSLLRFAAEFSTRVNGGLGQLRRGSDPLPPAELLRCKIALGTATCSIASGSNAVASLLDLTVMVTLMRIDLEGYWAPKAFGDSAQPLLTSVKSAELEIWRLAGTVLTPDQQAELRAGIEDWHRLNPQPEAVVGARAAGFAAQLTAPGEAKEARSGSVFGLLRLDPLSGLDPATREIAQSRLFAERALFVMQQMPQLLRWQMELLSLNATELPAVQQVVANSTKISESVDRFAKVAEQLPGQLRTEREEILKAFSTQEKELTPLFAEVRQTLAAGTQMSTSLNTTVDSLDALMKRFGVGEPTPPGPTATPREPFRIMDYAKTAAQLEVTARQLTELIHSLDQTLASPNLTKLSAQVGPVVEQAQTSGKAVVDYAFWRAVLLVAIMLVAALGYRFLAARLPGTTRTKTNQP